MTQDIPRSIFNCREIQISQLNGEGKTESNGSTDSWLIDVKNTFIPPHKIWQVSTKVCIYRVPKGIMDSKPEDYVPSVISFGPYHYRKTPHLIKTDQYKIEALHKMVARLKIDVSTIIAEVQKLENEIRECYAEPIDWDGETLCWMLTMDTCFILEFFKSAGQTRRESDGNYFSLVFQNSDTHNCMSHDILKDIFKLENQIPLCTLITLLQLECETPEKATTELAERLSRNTFFQGNPFPRLSGDGSRLKLKEYLQKNLLPCHLLDLSRMIMKDVLAGLSPIKPVTDVEYHASPLLPGRTLSIPCSILQGAGIKFKPGNIGFEKKLFGSSTLFLPRIRMSGRTETRLRNLVAYEECQRCSWSPEETLISRSLKIIKDLIDSGKDISILKNSGIIWGVTPSNEDTARMFKSIMNGTTLDQSEEAQEVLRRVREHYKSQWRMWISQFREEYFSKPWHAISLLVGILLLCMTAIQAVYSVKK